MLKKIVQTNSIPLQLPNTSALITGMEDIVKQNYNLIPQAGIARMRKIADQIKTQMETVIPPIKLDLFKGKSVFRDSATQVRNKVDAVISDIHLKTLKSSKSFEDVYERFGPDRSLMSTIACMLIMLVCILFYYFSSYYPPYLTILSY